MSSTPETKSQPATLVIEPPSSPVKATRQLNLFEATQTRNHKLERFIQRADSKAMTNFSMYWELQTIRSLRALPVDTLLVCTKFRNYRNKREGRIPSMCKIAAKTEHSITFKNTPDKNPNPDYPFVPRRWTFSWEGKSGPSPITRAIEGSVHRKFYKYEREYSDHENYDLY